MTRREFLKGSAIAVGSALIGGRKVWQSLARVAAAPSRLDRISVRGTGSWFLLGVNYPGLRTSEDFGASGRGYNGVGSVRNLSQVDRDFADMTSSGVKVVRWWLFGDCRASPEFDKNGYVTGFDEFLYRDIDAALDVAEKHDVFILFSLLDYSLLGVEVGSKETTWVADRDKQLSFLENALKPLLNRYGEHGRIIAWETMNEPERGMDGPDKSPTVGKPLKVDEMIAFNTRMIDYVRRYASQPATVGSIRRSRLDLWRNSRAHFYQFHYDDSVPGLAPARNNTRGEYPLDYPYANLRLDKPCILGEFPTNGTPRRVTEYLDAMYTNGYAGALAWAYRSRHDYYEHPSEPPPKYRDLPEQDDSACFRCVAKEFAAWARAHERDVNIQYGGREPNTGERRERGR